MKKIFCLISILWLSGCDSNITDFVSQVKAPSLEINVPVLEAKGAKTIKISPGHAITQGAHYGAELTVTPTNKMVSGTHYSAELSINQQRR